MSILHWNRTSAWEVSSNVCNFLQIDQEDEGSQVGMPTTTNESNYYKHMQPGPSLADRRATDTQGRPEPAIAPGLASEHPCGLVFRLIKTRIEKTAYARVHVNTRSPWPQRPTGNSSAGQQSALVPRPRVQNAIPSKRSWDSRETSESRIGAEKAQNKHRASESTRR